jgi:hypothetical protein
MVLPLIAMRTTEPDFSVVMSAERAGGTKGTERTEATMEGSFMMVERRWSEQTGVRPKKSGRLCGPAASRNAFED